MYWILTIYGHQLEITIYFGGGIGRMFKLEIIYLKRVVKTRNGVLTDSLENKVFHHISSTLQ